MYIQRCGVVKSSIILMMISGRNTCWYLYYGTFQLIGMTLFVVNIGSFHVKSPRNCRFISWILTKLGVFVVPMVLIIHTNF